MIWADILVLASILALAGLVVYYLVRRHKQGGCCSGCAGCPYGTAENSSTKNCRKCDKNGQEHDS